VKYPPQFGRYKVYIIDEVHMLSAAAFNALLKTLEEPPAHVVFILATTDPQRLPATILSRVQRFDFSRIPAAKIAGRLREAADGEKAEADDDALMMIARAAEGGMRDALSLLDMCVGSGRKVTVELVREILGTGGSDFLFRFAEALEAGDAAALFGMIDEVMRAGRDPSVFAREVAQHLRALLMAKCCPGETAELLETGEDTAEKYREQAEGFTELRLIRMQEGFLSVESSLRTASSPRIVLENTALRCCLRTKETDAAALTERIGELEKQLDDLRARLASGQAVAAPAPAEPQAAAPAKAAQPAEKKAPAVSSNVWKELLNRLKRSQEPAVYAALCKGRLIGCADGVYRWAADTGFEFMARQVSQQAKRDLISQMLTEIAGEECRFEPGEAPQEKRAGSDTGKMLSELRSTFGPDRVSVQE